MVDRRLDDAGRRAADRGVAALERRPATRRVVRHDHGGGDDRDDDAGGAITSPARRRPCANACQRPSIATTRPICSFVRHAAPAQSANGSSRSSSRNQIAPSSSGVASATGMEVVDDEPLRRRVEEVDEREAEARPLGAEVLAGEQEDGQRAERDADGLRRRGAGRGSARATRAGASSATSGSKCAPRREICVALEVGHLEEPAVRRRPDGLGEVADVEAARLERPLLEHGERRHPGRERADRDPEQRARPGHAPRSRARAAPASARRAPPRSRAPRTSPGPPRRAASAQRAVGGEPPHRGRERLRVARRNEQRVVAVGRAAPARPACRR